VLYQFLTLKTVACPRNGFQPLGFYVRATLHALTEGSLTNAFKSLLEASERLSSSGCFERTSLSFVLSGGLIGSIRVLDGTRPYLLLGIGDDAFRFCNVSFKNSLVMFDCALRWQSADLDGVKV
jgi:hypothetical protein